MSTRRALFFSFLDRHSALAFSILSTIVIARLLTPEEIGVFSVSMVLTSLVASFRDMGAGQYLVQERELTADRVRASWAVFLGTGTLLGLLMLAASYPVAAFYGEPRMTAIVQVVAVSFFVTPFGSMTYAWLMREMRFQDLAVMRFISGLAGAATSIGLAWAGVGALSLAFGSLASTLANAAVAALYRPSSFGWMPGLREIKRVLGFGSQISLAGLLGVLTAGIPELLLGKLQSLLASGLYSRSNGLAALFHRIVLDATQTVALPLFSSASRSGQDLAPAFLKGVSYVTALGWAFFFGLALLANPTTRLLYGTQWDASVPVTQVLAVAFSIGLPTSLCPQLLMGVGRARTVLRLYVLNFVISGVLIGVGAHHSLFGAALGFAAAQAAMLIAWTAAARNAVGFRLRGLLVELLRSLTLACITALAAVVSVLLWGFQPNSSLLSIMTAVVLGPPLLWWGAKVLRHPIAAETEKILQWARGHLRRSAIP